MQSGHGSGATCSCSERNSRRANLLQCQELVTALEEDWVEHTLLRTHNAIAESPWLAGCRCLQQGCVSAVTLANTLLTSEWFDDGTIDACLDAIRLKMEAKAVDPTEKIAGTSLAVFTSLPNSNSTTLWGDKLRTGLVKQLLMPGNRKLNTRTQQAAHTFARCSYESFT